VAERKAFLLRIAHEILTAVQRWANDDLRSLNGQIEFLLRRVLEEEGRLQDRKGGAGSQKRSRRAD
jgi:hypothetical protein